ncbi:hypothetical protein HJC23_010457 [Cyclotella cryptica]|uniref:Uncharacterized protein n=1 Tax=Cyclotella cryptica TaxID=29204 RepID=A0ABD3QHZ9_9STRA
MPAALSPKPTQSSSTTAGLSPSSSMTDVVTSSPDRSYYYLSSHAATVLPRYQYHGEDLSLLYKHVLSPLAGGLVERIPMWVAPNVITLGGLALMALSYGVIWACCPGLYEGNEDVVSNLHGESRGGVPSQIFLLNCIAMLLYQTLDNMDGKQARRTGSSSPLGLLFDHGCDAVNSIFGSGNWICAMGLYPGRIDGNSSIISQLFGGEAVLAALLILCPMIAFYVSTWEQYYTGKLVLPPFNGPSEGLLLGASLSFLSWYKGVMFWHETGLADGLFAWCGMGEMLTGRIRNLDLIVLSSVLALCQEVALKVAFVIRKHGVGTVKSLMPHFLLVASSIVLIAYDNTLLVRSPRTVMHLIAGLFVEQTTQLMLDHMVEEEFLITKRFGLYPLVALATLMVGCDGHVSKFISVQALDACLLAYTTGLWVYLAFKIRVLIYEICDVLGIWCFDIVTPYESSLCYENGDTNDDITMAEASVDIVNSTLQVDLTRKKVV